MNAEILKKIIEASSAEILNIETGADVFLENFKLARRAYFVNDLQGLEKCYSFFKAKESNYIYASFCCEILHLRILIRENKVLSKDEIYDFFSDTYLINESKEINSIKNLDFDGKDLSLQILLVELLAVEAILCDQNGLFDKSYQKNIIASLRSEKLGMMKKSSTLLFNSIVAINHKTPTHLKICNLTDAIHKAEACEDNNTVIAALTSLAQEYEKLGCLNLAYEECSKAIVLAKKHCFGSYNFCMVLLNGVRLSAQIGNIGFANENLKLVETFNFQELKDEVVLVKDLIDSKDSADTLSGDEQKLIQLLTTSPKDKYYLIERLYGAGDSESLVNRLKQLLLRLRKKRKGLISYNKKNCLYELMH